MLRTRTLIVLVAVAMAAAALSTLRTRAVPDAPRSLSAEQRVPMTAPGPESSAAALVGARRSAEVPASDDRQNGDEPVADVTSEQSSDAPNSVTASEATAPPEATLLVDAVGLDGAPVPGAKVQLEQVFVGPTGVVRHTLDHATADDRGRVRFELYDLEEVRAAGVVARLEEPAGSKAELPAVAPAAQLAPASTAPLPVVPRLASALVRLDAPLHAPALAQPVRLVLDVSASVVVRVHARDDAPLARHAVLVDDLDPDLGWWLGGIPNTNERGEAHVAGLPAGRYRFSLLGEPDVEPRELALLAGERAELEFVVVVPTLERAASGRVVDEEGRPLAGREVTGRLISAAGDPRTVDAGTDDEGRFELHAPPAERIVVSASAGLFCDEYEPAEIEVPFGARELVFRRTRSVPFEAVEFEVVDASTGQLVRDVLVMTYRANARGDHSFHTAEEGRPRPRCSIHADTTFMLDAPGYRRRALLAADLAATASDGEMPRVTLEPGVLRELRVIDAGGRPIAGAVVTRGATVLGTTDVDGLFIVDLPTWPDTGLAVTAETHAPSTWNPRDGCADLTPAEVVLADPSGAGG